MIATYNAIFKSYTNGRVVLVFSERAITPIMKERIEYPEDIEVEKTSLQIAEDGIRNFERSMRRTNQTVYDIAFSNHWEAFITVTFDGLKVDRYNYEEIAKKFGKLLGNVKNRKAKDLQYLLVPEPHSDGAIHFHGLLSGLDGLTVERARGRNGMLSDGKGRPIFNVKDFNLGFTTLTYLEHSEKACTYITKYITKENVLGCGYIVGGKSKNRYWCSKDLRRPDVEKIYLTQEEKDQILEYYAKNKETVSDKTVSVDVAGYANTFRYITLQESFYQNADVQTIERTT